MNLRSILMVLVLLLALCAASVMDIILFESIKKIGILKFDGQKIVADVVEETTEDVKLKYHVDGQDYFLTESKAPLGDLLNGSNKIDLIFDRNYPQGAVTLRYFKRLDSFFILFVLGFIIITFAIFIFIRKIISVYYFYTDENHDKNEDENS